MKYNKICVFAGTTEGRQLVKNISDNGMNVTACVATEYGEVLIEKCDNITIHTGRLDTKQMIEYFNTHQFDVIIDATHPFAAIVTDNLINATQFCNIEYVRLLRDSLQSEYGQYFNTIKDAVQYLSTKQGNILLTTGSKELCEFSCISNYTERIYPRVLPLDSSLDLCKSCGYKQSHIIAMQGPFTEEMNLAMIKMFDIKYLVTKESGVTGGFIEKINAAEKSRIECIIIGRPPQVDGFTYNEILQKLNIEVKKDIVIIGTGVGSSDLLTLKAYETLKFCDIIIGAKRVVDSCNIFDKPCEYLFLSDDIVSFINNSDYNQYAVVMSGDVGFYSGATKLIEKLNKLSRNVEVVNGISTPVYMSAKLGIPWDNMKLCSLHARNCNIIHYIKTNYRTFTLTGGEYTTKWLLDLIHKYNFNDLFIYIGERLSYQDEKITTGNINELINGEYDDLSSVIIENPLYSTMNLYGINDDNFIRADKIPMTKSEIRALSVAKLNLKSNSIVYDIGAGTGSVSIEIANLVYDGIVYAIEKKSDAVELIDQNKLKFKIDNIVTIKGTAPNILSDLPSPTHAFIGGTSGNLSDIIDILITKNPNIRIIINSITLETVSETLNCIKKFNFANVEITNVSIAKSKILGGYNMMMGQNPIYIISLENYHE